MVALSLFRVKEGGGPIYKSEVDITYGMSRYKPFEKSESLWVRCRARKKTGYLLFKHEVLVPNKTSEANIVPIPPDLQTQKPFFHHLSLILSKLSKNLYQHPSTWDNLVGDFLWFLPQNILSRSEFLAPLGPERSTAALHFPGWCLPCHL